MVNGTKSRILVHKQGTGLADLYYMGSLFDRQKVNYSITGKQVTVSGNHPEWGLRNHIIRELYRLKPTDMNTQLAMLRDLDIGGTFWTERQNYVHNHAPLVKASSDVVFGGLQWVYNGPVFPYISNIDKDSPVWPATPDFPDHIQFIRAMGATAISRTVPTAPSFSLITALGEIRNDGIPTILGGAFLKARKLSQLPKTAAGEYLNFEFGWKPFIADIRKLCSSVMKSEKILSDYEKGSGKNIFRHYEFPEDVSVTTSEPEMGSVLYPALATYCYDSYQGSLTKTVKTERKVWFEGTYRYNVPSGDDVRSQIASAASKAEHLLGLRITPEVLWNLQPWTWLVDWFLNIGDLLTNFSAFGTDELMLKRGYVMCSTNTTVTYTHQGTVYKNGGPGVVSQSFSGESKLRLRASPWGFGVTFEEFTPRQIAILAALGITQGDSVAKRL